MAWEEESIESGADFEEVGGGKNKLKLIIIVLLVAGLAAAGWFMKDKFLGGEDEPKEETAKTAKAEKPAKTPEKGEAAATGEDESFDEDVEDGVVGFRINLDKFTVNLSGDGQHFLIATIVLVVTPEALRDEFLDPDDKALTKIKTRDLINGHLRKKTYAQMRDSEESAETAEELKHKLSRMLKSGRVLNVYYEDFLVE